MLAIVNAMLANLRLQVPGIVELGLKPRKIKKVAVVGGGLMGSGIVTALILSGYSVLLKEINDKFLQAGLERIKGTFVVLWHLIKLAIKLRSMQRICTELVIFRSVKIGSSTIQWYPDI